METALTEDALLGGRVRLLQSRRGYRFAVDAVLLAACSQTGGLIQMFDSTSIRAHVSAARAKGGQESPALGRSRGG